MKIVCIAAMAVLFPGFANAMRLVPAWEIERLLKESDLVVLAYPTAVNTRPELDKDFVDRSDRGYLTTAETQFKVIAQLKGEAPADQIQVLHYELKDDAVPPGNGPNLPRFTSKIVLPRFADMSSLQGSTFMLFLRKNEDATIEFVTGRYDSVFSVKQLLDAEPDDPHPQPSLPKW